jgi:hypothetical protein
MTMICVSATQIAEVLSASVIAPKLMQGCLLAG